MQMRSPVGTYFRPAADTKGPRERLANPGRKSGSRDVSPTGLEG